MQSVNFRGTIKTNKQPKRTETKRNKLPSGWTLWPVGRWILSNVVLLHASFSRFFSLFLLLSCHYHYCCCCYCCQLVCLRQSQRQSQWAPLFPSRNCSSVPLLHFRCAPECPQARTRSIRLACVHLFILCVQKQRCEGIQRRRKRKGRKRQRGKRKGREGERRARERQSCFYLPWLPEIPSLV